MILNTLAIIFGIGLLVAGAEGLVRGASSIAAKFKISPLVIGLTIVAFGTSAPELTVNLVAAVNGSSDIAVGNVVGSNIVNILFILGICAVIIPLTVKSSTVWKEIPFALLGMVLLFIMGNDQFFDGVANDAITRTDGFALLAMMAIFMYYIFGMAKNDRELAKEEASETEELSKYSFPASTGMTIGGLILLVLGGRFLVQGATDIAAALGMSETLIGLTVVAIGTSLPELATSVVAALRGHADIAIGNVVGSNIFNVFFVLGISSTILPLPLSKELNIDIAVGVITTLVLFISMFVWRKHRLTRLEGFIFIGLYVAYVAYLVARG